MGAVVASCVLVGAAPPCLAADAAEAQPQSDDAFVAVLALGPPSDAARRAARAVYRSRLRPPDLDEESARALVGDLAAGTGSAAARELAELRDGVRGEDAASRQVLAAIGRRLKLKGVLVVTGPSHDVGAAAPTGVADGGASVALAGVDAGAPAPDVADASAASPPGLASADGGANDVDASTATDPEAILRADANMPAPTAASPKARARLFHVGLGTFDAATYGSDDTTGWGSTVASLERLFPAPGYRKALKVKEETPSKPFYASPWFWGGLGAAVLFGGAFYFASRDSGGDTIHLQMRVP
jgi:hypothetical protein